MGMVENKNKEKEHNAIAGKSSGAVSAKGQQMRKGILSYAVLLSIKNHKEAYASSILKDLKKANLIVVEGTVYPLLNRFKGEGLLDYEWKESKSGPPRKYYKLTKEGKQTLKDLQKTWEELTKSINNLTN